MGEWLDKHGVGKRYQAATLEGVNSEIRSRVGGYLQGLRDHVKSGKGLLLTGSLGTGKTCILALVMKQAYEVMPSLFSAYFVYAQDLFDVLIPKTEEDKTNLWRWQSAELLCIDGFGEAYEHEWPYSKFERFLEERYANNLTTCISTNLAMKDLLDNAKYARIIDRLKTMCLPFELSGKSRRESVR